MNLKGEEEKEDQMSFSGIHSEVRNKSFTKSGEPLTLEKLKTFEGFRELEEKELASKLNELKSLAAIIYEIFKNTNTQSIDNQCYVSLKPKSKASVISIEPKNKAA